MIYKMETLDRVIDKIVRDLGLQDDIPFGDFVEWFADALLHIGSYPQFEEKSCAIIIDDYEGMLPSDLYKVIRVLKGSSFSQSVSGGFYDGTFMKALTPEQIKSLDPYDKYKNLVAGISKIDNNLNYRDLLNILSYNGNLIGNPENTKFTEGDYNINFNKVTTGFRYGIIELQYLAFPVDERGWPLVPDDVSFRDALFWKVAYHMSMRDPSKLKNPRMQDMEYCRQMWNKYCTQARTSAIMPDMAQIERLKNNWLRLHNTLDDNVNQYRDLGKQQRINLDGR